MSFGDKVDAKKDQVVGGAKEGIGDATGNPDLQSEGTAQQTKGDVKEGWENAKDKAADAVSNVKEKLDGDGR
ncbi:CsbD family protein [Cumulibacter manganitolerans]|uniref:CsbD family protein n=1 Tax=Cumulibacter manganitolerans TaxID=1884992 RepID=UPI00129675A0|nr:CsbD family protein [Cumulibacter manganitolerans]